MPNICDIHKDTIGKYLRENGLTKEVDDLRKLEPFRNTWHERVIREEVKQAAKDGKTKLQFPTGETAMKIEGLGSRENFRHVVTREGDAATTFRVTDIVRDPSELKVGNEVQGAGANWIITRVLDEGKFYAVPKATAEKFKAGKIPQALYETGWEQFDISGKVDTSNPIYKFYEKEVGKYLKNKYGATLITDPQGVQWWEVNVKPEHKKLPVEAFGVGTAVGIGASQNDN